MLTNSRHGNNLDNWVIQIPENKQGYVLLRINHPLSKILYSGGDFRELAYENMYEVFQILQKDIYGQKVKKYFIEALYSLATEQSTGHIIYGRLNAMQLHDDLKKYNDSLYVIFQKLKPVFVKLEAIRTWKEMDKNYKSLEELFSNPHPIMFIQILSENPSTVLESKKLCNLKQNALIKIIKNTNLESFYSSYRFAYLNELLIDENYSVRFLDKVMNRVEKRKFILDLEN